MEPWQNDSDRGETCFSVTLSTSALARRGLGLKPGLLGGSRHLAACHRGGRVQQLKENIVKLSTNMGGKCGTGTEMSELEGA